jgi:dihydrofolate reductase
MKVILLMALTADGKIAKDSDHFPDWTGKADKKLFVSISKKAGVLIMGSKTFDTIGAPLPHRLNVVMTRNKSRISKWDNLVYTDAPPREVLAKLDEQGYTEVVLAGGRTINDIFGREELIDEIDLTIAPKIFGAGLSLFSEAIEMDLELLHFKELEPNVIYLKYKVLH